MTDELTVEAEGETVAEARWAALRKLEGLAPDLDREAVRFQVVSEGQRGLLGVGYEPARVLAAVTSPSWSAAAPADETAAASRLRELLTRIAAGLGVHSRIEIVETDAGLVATYLGDELGLVIGRHGQTIDAIQTLASAIVLSGAIPEGQARRELVIDAAGYRDRRRRTLESVAARAADDALRSGGAVTLDPMSAAERKLVHTYLEARADVVTSSAGVEPNRCVVVEPAGS